MSKIAVKTEGLEGDALAFAIQLNEAFKNLPEGITKEQLEEKMNEIKENSTLLVSKADFDILHDMVNEIKESTTSGAGKAVTMQQEVTANKEALKTMMKDGSKEVTLKATTTRAAVDSNSQGVVLPGIGQLIRIARSAYNVFRKVKVPIGTHKGTIRYLDWDEATTVKAAAMVAEGAPFQESTASFKEYTLSLKKVGDTLPVTEEFFEDEAMAAAELEMFLENNVDDKINSQVIVGDNTGENIKGLLVSIDAYNAAGAGIADANIYDLITLVKGNITSLAGGKYNPDVAIMNNSTINKLLLKKDAHGQYLFPPQHPIFQMIVEDNYMPDNQMVVGDRRFGTIYEMGGVVVSRGMINDQFNKDLLTIKARKRLLFLIKNSDKTGFRKVTDITAALATIAS